MNAFPVAKNKNIKKYLKHTLKGTTNWNPACSLWLTDKTGSEIKCLFIVFVFSHAYIYKYKNGAQLAGIDWQTRLGWNWDVWHDPGATPPRFLPPRTNVLGSWFCQRDNNVIRDLKFIYLDIYTQDTWILFGIFTFKDCWTALFTGRKYNYGSKSRCVCEPRWKRHEKLVILEEGRRSAVK